MRAAAVARARPPMKRRSRPAPGASPGQRRLTSPTSRFGECPVCARSVPKHDLPRHADACLAATPSEDPTGPVARDGAARPSDTAPPPRSAFAALRRSGDALARVRLGGGRGGARFVPVAVDAARDAHGVPIAVLENALPAADADALLAELLEEGLATWTQDEWWIAGENRLAPRLTATYDLATDLTEPPEPRRPDASESEYEYDSASESRPPRERPTKSPTASGTKGRLPSPLMLAAARRAGEMATEALRTLTVGGDPIPRADDQEEKDPSNASESNPFWSPTYLVANLYRDGSDRVGPHADRLTSLGPLPVIVGYSLGATRTFRVRKRWCAHPDALDDVELEVRLPHNSLVAMLPPCQELWTHEIVREGGKQKQPPVANANVRGEETAAAGAGARVSLTFRRSIERWEAAAPTCACGRRCVLKTRRADAPPPAFARRRGSGGGGAGSGGEEGTAKTGRTAVAYYYTCDSTNGGPPCSFYQPARRRDL